ncbi:hypothetical protein V6N11_001456 [Hibiscus sabdariffa]|uniref:Uncharacterized protein n=1 Tax=Hibiscus sabdariffa TaxID=183260 RepID=A0ABR2S023_9ROSI
MGNAILVTYRSPTFGSGRELFKDQNGVVVQKILLAWLGRHRRDGCLVFLQVTVPGLAACSNVSGWFRVRVSQNYLTLGWAWAENDLGL